MILAATEDLVGGSWSVLPLEAILMSIVWITTKGHVDAHGLCYCLKSGWYPWPVLPLEAMSMSTACTVAKGHNGACGLCSGQELLWCLWSELLPETMLRYMVHADGCWRSCECLWSLCYHQKPCGSPWSMLPLTENVKEASFSVVSIISVSHLRMRDIEGFCDYLFLPTRTFPKRNSLDRKPLKRTLNLILWRWLLWLRQKSIQSRDVSFFFLIPQRSCIMVFP